MKLFPPDITSATSPRAVVILVHGTFAPRAPWTRPDSLLAAALKRRLMDPEILTVQWTGGNTFQARIDAGMQLVDVLASVPPGIPVAIISHSHGGSAICYAQKYKPEAFGSVNATVCLATPFFGFSVRPGYQSLLFGIVAALSFLLFQATLAAATIFGRLSSPRFDEEPFLISFIGATLFIAALAVARSAWKNRAALYRSLDGTVATATAWDTTQVELKGALFARSMGDEVGLGLATLQFACTVLNKLLNFIATVVDRCLNWIQSWSRGRAGKIRAFTLFLPLIVVSALPAAMAAEFGYALKYWVDILNPWSATFNFFEPKFGLGDQLARVLYAAALVAIAIPYILGSAFVALVLITTLLSWLTVGALGKFSFGLAIATQWAVEPTPEGQHFFLNGGWIRDLTILERDRPGLQHSEPYSAPNVVAHVVEFVASRILPSHTN